MIKFIVCLALASFGCAETEFEKCKHNHSENVCDEKAQLAKQLESMHSLEKEVDELQLSLLRQKAEAGAPSIKQE